MGILKISVLGPFQVWLNENPVIHFESSKVRALISYLVVEQELQHSREFLAEFLWPGYTRASALGNLRYTISSLKKNLNDQQTHCLVIMRDSLQFNKSNSFEVDAWEFVDLIHPSSTGQPAIHNLERAVSLYRGPFLDGFCLPNCAPFEEWLLLKREQYTRLMLKTLNNLADYCVFSGDYEQAQNYAWKQIEIEPWLEEGYQQLMRALAFAGQRSAALSQFDICRKLLDRELGIEPGRETVNIFEAICKDDLASLRSPRNLTRQNPLELSEPLVKPGAIHCETPFERFHVGFQAELASLERCLDEAISGSGRLVFISGGFGSGKTSLADQFACQAMQNHPNLIVACGACSATVGMSDPYLPFSEILQVLTRCDLPHGLRGGGLLQLSRRLDALLPHTLQIVAEQGADLVESLLPAELLMKRASSQGSTFSNHIQFMLDRDSERHLHQEPFQPILFEQITHVLFGLAQHAPLLLVIDDLHWADGCSTSLLFHLGRRIQDSQVLILALYRPEDLFSPETESSQPLERVINELITTTGASTLDLEKIDKKPFFNEYLDREPNHYSQAFRDRLFGLTQGNPLYVSELLVSMQARGELQKDLSGAWVCRGEVDWDYMPDRLRMVIAGRLQRLPPSWFRLLQAASVEGELFIAEIVAQLVGLETQSAIHLLGGPLYRQLRLVQPCGFKRRQGKPLSSYRFTYPLYQIHLYNEMDEAERAGFHEQAAWILENLFEPVSENIAHRITWHYQRAHYLEKA